MFAVPALAECGVRAVHIYSELLNPPAGELHLSDGSVSIGPGACVSYSASFKRRGIHQPPQERQPEGETCKPIRTPPTLPGHRSHSAQRASAPSSAAQHLSPGPGPGPLPRNLTPGPDLPACISRQRRCVGAARSGGESCGAGQSPLIISLAPAGRLH